jgi:hypothetical protein
MTTPTYKTMARTKSHFEDLASLIGKMQDDPANDKRTLVRLKDEFERLFSDNPQFDRASFEAACHEQKFAPCRFSVFDRRNRRDTSFAGF